MREQEAIEILQMIADEMGIPSHARNRKPLTVNSLKKIKALCLAAATLLSPEESNDFSIPEHSGKPLESETLSLNKRLRAIEKNAIIEALTETNFNRTKAAELLGISTRQLRYKLAAHDIN